MLAGRRWLVRWGFARQYVSPARSQSNTFAEVAAKRVIGSFSTRDIGQVRILTAISRLPSDMSEWTCWSLSEYSKRWHKRKSNNSCGVHQPEPQAAVAWFLYEFLTGKTLDFPDLQGTVGMIDLLDDGSYYTAPGRISRRHRVRDNLLGSARFCPIIRRTIKLTTFVEKELGNKANETVGQAGANVVARAASFLLLADSRASFAIEGERPPRGRLERWARAVLTSRKDSPYSRRDH